MRTQTISFHDFMNPPVMSGITLPNLDDLADQGFILVCSVGALALLMAKLENDWAKKGKHQQADRLAGIGFILFPAITIGAGIWYLIINNPVVRFWL